MDVDQVVLLGRMTLQEVVILAGPILAIAIVVSLVCEHCTGAHLAAGHDYLHRRAIDGHRRRIVSVDALDVAASRHVYAFNFF